MISDSPEGILLESVIEGYNQFYSAELSQKIRRGNQINLDKGLWTGGTLAYGYKIVDKKVLVDEQKAEIVRLIYKDYASGKSKTDICKDRYLQRPKRKRYKSTKRQSVGRK
jgi:DNA invertase Pin-like site-specific DNA recombinase